MGQNGLNCLLKIVGPALIMVAGFFNFIKFSGYPYLRLELALSAAVLAVIGITVGLLGLLGRRYITAFVFAGAWVLFFDSVFEFWNWHPYWLWILFIFFLVPCLFLQRHLAVISAAAVSTIILSTAFLPVGEAEIRGRFHFNRHVSPLDLPPVIHIILDGHISTKGITSTSLGQQTLRIQITDFFVRNDFMLFENAYSHFFNSQQSIPHALNFSDDPSTDFYAGGFHVGDTLSRNVYFDRMIKRGYQVHVIQTDYIDFCLTPGVLVTSCYSVVGTGPRPLDDLEITAKQKFRVIMSQFLELSLAYQNLRRFYNHRVQPMLLSWNIGGPDWNWERKTVFPISAPKTFLQLARSITGGATGRLFFAHLGIPHEPYVFREDCSIRESVDDWADRVGSSTENLRPARTHRSRLYFDQIICTQKLLAQLFETLKAHEIYDRSLIIIHGDHGSRIMSTSPRMKHRDKLSKEDLIAGYSTLFAVKSPKLTPGVDQRLLPIDWLLEFSLFGERTAPPPTPFVYLSGSDNRFVAVPFSEPDVRPKASSAKRSNLLQKTPNVLWVNDFP